MDKFEKDRLIEFLEYEEGRCRVMRTANINLMQHTIAVRGEDDEWVNGRGKERINELSERIEKYSYFIDLLKKE